MDCLVSSIEAAGYTENVEVVVDVHASRLVPPSSAEGEEGGTDEERSTSYDLTAFSGETAIELTSTQALLDIYLEWLEKYPITTFVEPFAAADVAMSKELLIRGNQVLQAKIGGEAAESQAGEVQADKPAPTDNLEGSGGEESCLLRIIADESVCKLPQLVFVNEQRGANAVMVNTSKFSTVSEMVTLTSRARELGWAIIVAAVDEQELEGDFLTEFGVGLRAEQLLLGGLRSASTVAACTRLMRIEDDGVAPVDVGNE